ncbi:hypothetical protein NQ317_013305 [Molorchus minor]|uniref:PH domain-containing protein n=1 Tax=Molorchus minor TaxID=1323400 RepID=A0ABQ9JA00_9CUCU|nr:hypothetical protein NQ317_013305 [Molorchus minor]
MMRGVRRGCVRLKGAVIGMDDEDDSTFTVTVDHKTFHFQARDAEERQKWVQALEETIIRHGSRKLEERITTMNDPDEKTKCQLILDHANILRCHNAGEIDRNRHYTHLKNKEEARREEEDNCRKMEEEKRRQMEAARRGHKRRLG